MENERTNLLAQLQWYSYEWKKFTNAKDDYCTESALAWLQQPKGEEQHALGVHQQACDCINKYRRLLYSVQTSSLFGNPAALLPLRLQRFQ